MRAEWFDAVSALYSFTKHSKENPEAINAFMEILIRLTSMLHAAALAELEAGVEHSSQQLLAHTYEILIQRHSTRPP